MFKFLGKKFLGLRIGFIIVVTIPLSIFLYLFIINNIEINRFKNLFGTSSIELYRYGIIGYEKIEIDRNSFNIKYGTSAFGEHGDLEFITNDTFTLTLDDKSLVCKAINEETIDCGHNGGIFQKETNLELNKEEYDSAIEDGKSNTYNNPYAITDYKYILYDEAYYYGCESGEVCTDLTGYYLGE